MAESKSHRSLKHRLAGKSGKVEKPIPGGRRLDVRRGHAACEIERSGNPDSIRKAISRLGTQKNARKELRVPQKDLDKAAKIAKAGGRNITVKNLSGTKRRRIGK